MERALTFDEVAIMLSKQMRAVDAGNADLDVAGAQGNLAGKMIKLWALQLACAMFEKQGGELTTSLSKYQKKAIA
jgi:hypothetical protein